MLAVTVLVTTSLRTAGVLLVGSGFVGLGVALAVIGVMRLLDGWPLGIGAAAVGFGVAIVLAAVGISVPIFGFVPGGAVGVGIAIAFALSGRETFLWGATIDRFTLPIMATAFAAIAKIWPRLGAKIAIMYGILFVLCALPVAVIEGFDIGVLIASLGLGVSLVAAGAAKLRGADWLLGAAIVSLGAVFVVLGIAKQRDENGVLGIGIIGLGIALTIFGAETLRTAGIVDSLLKVWRRITADQRSPKPHLQNKPMMRLTRATADRERGNRQGEGCE
jgi:hypothetical protein